MDISSALARPSRLGAAVALGTAFAILVFCLIFQLVVPTPLASKTAYTAHPGLSIRSLVLYATAGGLHMLLSGGSIVFFCEQLINRESKIELVNIIIAASIVFCLIAAIILVGCYVDLKVVIYSYEERLRPLEGDPRLQFLLARHIVPFIHVNVQIFALYPIILTLFGAAAAVMACFWIAHKAIAFAHRADDLKKPDILELRRSLTQLVGLVTVVFTTSTIATIALMQIGRDWIEKGDMRDVYVQNGHAMSIFWSGCYTALTVLIIIFPLWWIAWRTRRIQRRAKHGGERPTLYDQIFENISYGSIAQAGIAALTPLLTSSAVAVFGS